MRNLILAGLVLLIVLAASTKLFAAEGEEAGSGEISNRQVGIGFLAGAQFPVANKYDYKITESWGFFVDIPLISTFHISPAAMLYRLEPEKSGVLPTNAGITDLTMNFKFVIPLVDWKLFFSALMGISNGHFIENDWIQMHVGGHAGFGYRVVSNLDLIAMCQYKLIIDGDQQNLNAIQAMGGMQFNF